VNEQERERARAIARRVLEARPRSAGEYERMKRHMRSAIDDALKCEHADFTAAVRRCEVFIDVLASGYHVYGGGNALVTPEDIAEMRQRLAAAVIDHNKPLPESLHEHTIEALRRPLPVTAHRSNREIRNHSIALAVETVMFYTGLKPTRNRARKDNTVSACQIVAEVSSLSEPSVEKAWEEWGEHVKADQGF
jgi:hypothetical protein